MKRLLSIGLLAASLCASTATDNGGVFQPTNIWSVSYDGTLVTSFLNPYNEFGSIGRNTNNESFFFAGQLTPGQALSDADVYIPGPQHCCVQPEHHPTQTPEHVTPEPATWLMLLSALVACLMLQPIVRKVSR